MDARTLTRLGTLLLAAALASGCETLRGLRLTPVAVRDGNATGVTPAEPILGGTVIAAGGAAQLLAAQPTAGQQPLPQQPVPPAPAQPVSGQLAPDQPAPGQLLPNQPPPGQLAQPHPLPAATRWPSTPGPTQSMTPPAPPPGVVAGPGHLPHTTRPADPHVRTTPTAFGGRLMLYPSEVPTDRVVELSMHLEALLVQNRELLAKIKELEAAGVGREQALNEAAREIEAVTGDAARTRSSLQAQVVALQNKARQLEEDDLIFLRAVLEALGRLLPPEKKP